MPDGGTKYLAFIGLCWVFFVQHAKRAGLPQLPPGGARPTSAGNIAALQRLEHEASDRQKGPRQPAV